jgi:hypothetical protein
VREIGRFGIFPDAPFTSMTDADTQRFGFQLSEDDVALLKSGDARVTVALEAIGARVRVPA